MRKGDLDPTLKIGQKMKVVRVKLDSSIPELMPIGHSNQSMTFIPSVASVYTPEGAFTFLDCPGFLDSRGPEINIAVRLDRSLERCDR